MSHSARLRLEALRPMQILCLESRMHENVPVRFGRGRLDSLATKGLAAYLIARGKKDVSLGRIIPSVIYSCVLIQNAVNLDVS